MGEPQQSAELNRLEADLARGAITTEDYSRFRTRLAASGPVMTDVAHSLMVRSPVKSLADEDLATWGVRVLAKLADFAVFVMIGLLGGLTLRLTLDLDLAGASVMVVILVYLVPLVVYDWVVIGTWGQTVGKMLFGIKVVRREGGRRVSYSCALGRVLSERLLGFFFSLPLVVSYLWPIWDEDCQTLHDKMAGTLVIKV